VFSLCCRTYREIVAKSTLDFRCVCVYTVRMKPSSKAQPFRVWFVGAHAVGKSTLAELTARNYNLPYISEQARIVLAERLQPDFDRLRLDVAETSRYQREVMRRQIATEQQLLQKATSPIAPSTTSHTQPSTLRASQRLRSYPRRGAISATSASRYVSDAASSSSCVRCPLTVQTVCAHRAICTSQVSTRSTAWCSCCLSLAMVAARSHTSPSRQRARRCDSASSKKCSRRIWAAGRRDDRDGLESEDTSTRHHDVAATSTCSRTAQRVRKASCCRTAP